MVIHFILKAQMKYFGLETNALLIPSMAHVEYVDSTFHSPYPGGNAVKARLEEKLQSVQSLHKKGKGYNIIKLLRPYAGVKAHSFQENKCMHT